MAKANIPIDSRLVRRNSSVTDFAIVDDTDVAGGYRIVANVTERNAIKASHLKVGMLCYVQSTGTLYQLTALTPTWAVFSGGGGGGLPAFSGTDGAAIAEDGNPSPAASFRRLTMDDIDAAFAVSLVAGFVTTKELGDAIANPAFTASYNAAVASATLTDETDTQTVPNPFTAFSYGVDFPARSYVKSSINATHTWTLAATKSGGAPVRNSTVTAAWRPRVFYQERVPAAYTEAFIEGMSGSALASALGRTIAYGAGGGTKKLYYCIPSAFGSPTSFKDAATLIAVPFTRVATAVAVTNAFGVVVAGGYDVWESDNFLTNAVSVIVA